MVDTFRPLEALSGYGKDFFLGQPFGQQKSQILVKIGNMR